MFRNWKFISVYNELILVFFFWIKTSYKKKKIWTQKCTSKDFSLFFVVVLLWDRVRSLYVTNPGWPQAHNPPASGSPTAGITGVLPQTLQKELLNRSPLNEFWRHRFAVGIILALFQLPSYISIPRTEKEACVLEFQLLPVQFCLEQACAHWRSSLIVT